MDHIVNALWRLRRLARAETALFHWRVYRFKAHRLSQKVRSYDKIILDLPGFSVEITDKAAHAEAKEALGQAEADYERVRDEVLLGPALDVDAKEGDTFGKRSLFRTLDEFRQIQGKRRNRPSSPISDAVTLDANDAK